VVVNTNKTVLTSVVDEVEELDGELIENEINYLS
jgi:hypothetical protein